MKEDMKEKYEAKQKRRQAKLEKMAEMKRLGTLPKEWEGVVPAEL